MSIITQIKNGDEQADVCDAIQDTALSIYKNIPNLKNEEYFKTWVIRITINKCYDILKKHKLNNEKMLKAQEDVSELHTNFDNNVILQTDLQTTLELLEEDLKIVTVLYYYNDLSISEISDILNIPKGTVKSRVFRAREKLYEILSKEEVDTIE